MKTREAQLAEAVVKLLQAYEDETGIVVGAALRFKGEDGGFSEEACFDGEAFVLPGNQRLG